MPRLLLVAFLAAAAPLAAAQSHIYIGPKSECTSMGMASNAWQCDLNWSANVAPGIESTVSIGPTTVTGVFSSAIVRGLILNGTSLQTLGSLQINDAFIWDGGSMSTGGTISVVGAASLQGAGKVLFGTDLRTEGTGITTWVGGDLTPDANSVIDNRGAFDIQADGITLTGTFINRANATLTRTVGTGTATIGNPMTNEGGHIDVRTGTLQIDGATLLGGTYNADAGATLLFSQFGAYTFSGTLAGDPAGSIVLDNGLSVVGLSGPTTLAFGGAGLEWQDGTLDPAGGTLTNGGLLVLTEFHDLSDGTLRNEGTIRWEMGTNLLSDFTIENAGLVDLQGTGSVLQGFTSEFVNLGGGTLLRSTSPADVSVGIPLTNADGGTIDLATGALVMGSNSSLDLQPGSRLEGTGTLEKGSASSVTFDGVVGPGASPGVLSWVGDAFFPFDPGASAVLDIEIGGLTAGTEYDQLAVTGPAILGGTLRVSLIDGFTPQVNDRFQIIASSSATTGTFDTLELPSGLEAYVEVSATGAELVIGRPVSTGADGPPEAFAVHPMSPNPAASRARLRFDVPEPSRVELALFDALGRQLAEVLDADYPAGTHDADLDVSGLPAGVYVVRVQAGAEALSQRFTVVR